MNADRDQIEELQWLSKHATKPHVRLKALVLLNWTRGRRVSELAAVFDASRTSIYDWRDRFLAQGAQGLEVQEGRGRKPLADPVEIERIIRQSPRNFGLAQTRWTLEGLARVALSLKGFSAFGVQKVLERMGFRYKRGQPWLHSPDPEYAQKKGLSTKR
jgi:transposase